MMQTAFVIWTSYALVFILGVLAHLLTSGFKKKEYVSVIEYQANALYEAHAYNKALYGKYMTVLRDRDQLMLQISKERTKPNEQHTQVYEGRNPIQWREIS